VTLPTVRASPPDPDSLLDEKAVAALLNIAPRTVWRLRDAGHLPAPVKIGSLIRWRRSAILRFLDESTEQRRR
jgi:predicted DNA-binding transcriptional regulator AlpA